MAKIYSIIFDRLFLLVLTLLHKIFHCCYKSLVFLKHKNGCFRLENISPPFGVHESEVRRIVLHGFFLCSKRNPMKMILEKLCLDRKKKFEVRRVFLYRCGKFYAEREHQQQFYWIDCVESEIKVVSKFIKSDRLCSYVTHDTFRFARE